MENLDFKGDYQTYVPLFSMLLNIANRFDAESLLNYGLDDGSLPWAVILSGFKDPAEAKVEWSEFLDQQWRICFSFLDFERDFSNLEFHKLSTFPFPKNIPIQHVGKDIQSGVFSKYNSHINTPVGIRKSRNCERDFYMLEMNHCLSRSSRVATKKQ